MTIELLNTCPFCKKRKLFTMKRHIKLPIGKTAQSKEFMCGTCYNKIKRAI